MPNMNIVLSVVTLAVTLIVLAVQAGFWGGGVSARAKPPSIAPRDEDLKIAGRLREVIERMEGHIRDARAIAHEARNIANVAAGKVDAQGRQVEINVERLDRAIAEMTRRTDELWRAVRSRGGESV